MANNTLIQAWRDMKRHNSAPYHLVCGMCNGTGELHPPRAEWDLLPPNCTRCAGSGRDEIPWSELFPIGRKLIDAPTQYHSIKERPPNRKERKVLRR